MGNRDELEQLEYARAEVVRLETTAAADLAMIRKLEARVAELEADVAARAAERARWLDDDDFDQEFVKTLRERDALAAQIEAALAFVDTANGVPGFQRRMWDILRAADSERARILADVKADAWDEGFDAGERDAFEAGSDDHVCIQNPYRKGQSENDAGQR